MVNLTALCYGISVVLGCTILWSVRLHVVSLYFCAQRVGATERMNLCQALTSAMDITMERDSSAGDYLFIVYLHTLFVNNIICHFGYSCDNFVTYLIW